MLKSQLCALHEQPLPRGGTVSPLSLEPGPRLTSFLKPQPQRPESLSDTLRLHASAVAALLVVTAAIWLSACNPAPQAPTADAVAGCWKQIPAPTVGAAYTDLTAIHALSPDDVWAVGSAGTPGGDLSRTLTMHWNGAQWSIVPSPNGPNPDTGRNSLYAVSGSSPDNVWAVGAYTRGGSQFRSLAMRWDGSRWSIVPTPDLGEHDDELKAVLAFGPADVWAVGSYLTSEQVDGHMVILHWDGMTWNRQPLPLNVTHTLLSIAARAPDDIWAVGTQVLHYNGKNWRILPTDESAYFDGVTVRGKDDVWIVGNDGSNALTLHWDGSRLNIVPVPAPAGQAFLHETVALPNGDIWAVGEAVDDPARRGAVIMKWTGESWTLYPNPLPDVDSRLQGVTQAGGSLWAVGSQSTEGNSKALFLRYRGEPCGGGKPHAGAVPAPQPTLHTLLHAAPQVGLHSPGSAGRIRQGQWW